MQSLSSVHAEFAKHPVACLTLASFLATNTGDVARRHIKDPELLSFIDIECYCWSTVLADQTPMINSGMVFCDRHYGGINYPIGGVGRIPEALADGLREAGSHLVYKANVRSWKTGKCAVMYGYQSSCISVSVSASNSLA